jgi:serine protease inhibitor
MITRAHVALLPLAGALSMATPLDVRAQDRAGVARHISTFGLDVFRHVSAAESAPNVVFSPLSAGLAIAVLAEGSERETRAELLAALGTSAGGWREFQRGIHALLTDLNADTTTLSRIANSLWAVEVRILSREFVEAAQRIHLASVDLQSDSAAGITRWAREKTNGRITNSLAPANPDLDLLLTNDVYFKGRWESPFDSTKTKLAPFLRAGGDSIHVPTMVRSAAFGHFEHNGERGLRIPYRGGRFAAYVVVPKSVSVADVVERLSVADVDGWNSRARARSTILYLPRVEHRSIWPLRTPLAQAGVRRVVSERAQLGALWATQQEGTIIDDAKQGTFLRIDEEGTETAVVKTGSAVVTSVQPPPVEFRVDAPFVFIIRDEVTGAMMFVARVGDPADRGR